MSVEPWDSSEFCQIHYCGRGSQFPQGHFKFTKECTNLEFSVSVLVFVRGAIWQQGEYYSYNPWLNTVNASDFT